MTTTSDLSRPHNCLLANLPAGDFERLRPRFEVVELRQRQLIHESMTLFRYAHFPEEGLISAVNTLDEGNSIEVASVGNEGMTGLPIVLGGEVVAQRYFVQIDGVAFRISAEALREEAGEGTPLRKLIYRYHLAFVSQIMQSVACNGLHSVQQRCCRWLLRCLDRSNATDVAITHEALAQMLGVRRASVTDVLRPLQTEGLIRHRRGLVSILDRKRLQHAACECHQVIANEFNRLICDPN